MGIALAIDYGERRVGLAHTDPMQMIASPLETVDTAKALDYIQSYCRQEQVSVLVMGKAKQMNGQDSQSAQGIQSFSDQLKAALPDIPLVFIDERFTSSMAQQALIAGGMKKKKRQEKGQLDQVAACIILQTYLDQSL